MKLGIKEEQEETERQILNISVDNIRPLDRSYDSTQVNQVSYRIQEWESSPRFTAKQPSQIDHSYQGNRRKQTVHSSMDVSNMLGRNSSTEIYNKHLKINKSLYIRQKEKLPSKLPNQNESRSISQEEEPKEKVESFRNKQVLKSLILGCRDLESQTNHQTKTMSEEVQSYQQYMNHFKNYIEFKEFNPYSEKDNDYEKEPDIGPQGKFLVNQSRSKSNLIAQKHQSYEKIRIKRSVQIDKSSKDRLSLDNLLTEQGDLEESKLDTQHNQSEIIIKDEEDYQERGKIKASDLKFDKDLVEIIRKRIQRKRSRKPKIYHEEMYSSTYWRDNEHKGYRSFVQQIQEMREEYNRQKLQVSCDVIIKAKNLKIKKNLESECYMDGLSEFSSEQDESSLRQAEEPLDEQDFAYDYQQDAKSMVKSQSNQQLSPQNVMHKGDDNEDFENLSLINESSVIENYRNNIKTSIFLQDHLMKPSAKFENQQSTSQQKAPLKDQTNNQSLNSFPTAPNQFLHNFQGQNAVPIQLKAEMELPIPKTISNGSMVTQGFQQLSSGVLSPESSFVFIGASMSHPNLIQTLNNSSDVDQLEKVNNIQSQKIFTFLGTPQIKNQDQIISVNPSNKKVETQDEEQFIYEQDDNQADYALRQSGPNYILAQEQSYPSFEINENDQIQIEDKVFSKLQDQEFQCIRNLNNPARNQQYFDSNSYDQCNVQQEQELNQGFNLEEFNQQKLTFDMNLRTQSLNNQKASQDQEQIKYLLKKLFSSYADISITKGKQYISQKQLIKLFKDSNVIDTSKNDQAQINFISQINLIICKVMKNSNSNKQQINFHQFLNIVLKVSKFKFSIKDKLHTKQGLDKIIHEYLIPLIMKIDNQAKIFDYKASEINPDKSSQISENTLYSLSEATQQVLKIDKKSKLIFNSNIISTLKDIYATYFHHEIVQGQQIILKQEELQKQSLKALMQFLRDFEISPVQIHQKACLLIWQSIQEAKNLDSSKRSSFGLEQFERQILDKKTYQIGTAFTLEDFLQYIFRVAVLFCESKQTLAQNSKKLLHFFRKMEAFDGFQKYKMKTKRPYNQVFTLIPSSKTLIKIFNLQISSSENKELILSLILDGPQAFQDSDQDAYNMLNITNSTFDASQKLRQSFAQGTFYQLTSNNNPSLVGSQRFSQTFNNPLKGESIMNQRMSISTSIAMNDKKQYFLESVSEELAKVFEYYCQIGNPCNNKKLSSSNFIKIFKDSNLLLQSAQKQVGITVTDLDLIYKSSGAQEQDDKMNTRKSFIDMQGNLKDVSQINNNFSPRLSLSNSQTTLQYSKSYCNNNGNRGSVNRISNATSKSQIGDKMDFDAFIKALEKASLIIFPNQQPILGLIMLIQKHILPLIQTFVDKRSIQSQLISYSLILLDQPEVIDLMSDMHHELIHFYNFYTNNRKMMSFDEFIKFCSDYSIFPDIAPKGLLYRIFFILSTLSEMNQNQNQNLDVSSAFNSRKNSRNSNVYGSRNVTKSYTSDCTLSPSSRSSFVKDHSLLIDEHLFVEALGLIALHKNTSTTLLSTSSHQPPQQYELQQIIQNEFTLDQQQVIEKILELVERISQSEGIAKRHKRNQEIKASQKDGRNILKKFQRKYYWFFEKKYGTKVMQNLGVVQDSGQDNESLDFNQVFYMQTFNSCASSNYSFK